MNAIIYVRVSSPDQVEGTSLESQTSACQDYAKRHHFNVVRVFVEEGESAKFADRTQLLQLLNYCRDKKNVVSTLIVWKLDRFARNVEDHFAIKAKLRQYGVSVVSVTEPIAADPNGRLMETILAGFAAFDNDVRAMRTVQGMQQKLREGLFPWKPPLGYLPPKTGRKTVPDIIDPKRFTPLQKAWQLLATGAYTKAAILKLLSSWGVRAYRGKPLSPQTIDHIFGNPYYAGRLTDPWTGAEYEGRHIPMISLGEFAKVQQILAGRSNTQPHHRVDEAFPLRGFVRCPTCQHPLTGAMTKGRSKRYPYYLCFQRACPTRTKSYPAPSIHDEFQQFLRELSIDPDVGRASFNELRTALAAERKESLQAARRLHDEKRAIERQLQELVTMRTARLISDAEFLAERKALHDRRFALEADLVDQADGDLSASEEESVVASLADISSLWHKAPGEYRRRFEQLMLPSGYIFGKVRTATKGLLFRVFGRFGDGQSHEVPLTRTTLNQLRDELLKLIELIHAVNEHSKRPEKAA